MCLRELDSHRPFSARRTLGARLAALLVVAWAAFLPAAQAEFRHALVIGQSAYKSGALPAPPRDVVSVAEALTKRGFTVTRAENLATVKELDDAVKKFARLVPTGGTALVYYSGAAALTVVPQAAMQGSDPLRQEPAFVALDGKPHPISAVLRLLVVPKNGPLGTFGLSGTQSGSRMNILVVDAATTPPDVAPLPDSLIVFRPADSPAAAADKPGLSPLAARFVAGLNSTSPLDAVLSGLSSRAVSSLADGELARLASPPSKAVSEPNTLGPGKRAGDEWVDANGMVFCWCPPGEFTIGSPATEPDRQPDELPAVVSFADGFWMAKHELCYREIVPLIGIFHGYATGDHKLHPFNDATGGPVDLGKVVAAANSTAPVGWEFGLPTEAEWEYAARAGTTSAYWFGDRPADLARHGNFADKTLRESRSFGERARTSPPKAPDKNTGFGDRQTGLYSYAHPSWNDGSISMARVGSYPPNPWGLCDMHGNVAEVTSTIFDPGRVAPVVAATEHKTWLAKPENRYYWRGYVCKGGSWASLPSSCRSAFRGSSLVFENVNGMRLVLRRKSAKMEPPAMQWTTLVPSGFSTTSGATAKPASDGSMLVTGAVAAGDSYTITCPIPMAIVPQELRLECLTDASLPGEGPGRSGSGTFRIAEVSINASHRGGPAGRLDVLDVRSDRIEDQRSKNLRTESARLVDGQLDTWADFFPAGKQREVIFTIGLPPWTGQDGARWRYPTTGETAVTEFVVTIVHSKDSPPLGKFRLAVLHENPAAKQEAAK